MGSSPLVCFRKCLSTKQHIWTYDLKFDQDDKNEVRVSEGLDHGKMSKILDGVAR